MKIEATVQKRTLRDLKSTKSKFLTLNLAKAYIGLELVSEPKTLLGRGTATLYIMTSAYVCREQNPWVTSVVGLLIHTDLKFIY